MYRKDITQMTEEEVLRVSNAFNSLFDSRTPRTNVKYNHLAFFNRMHIEDGHAVHGGPVFLPWHRYYVRKLEEKLQTVDPNITLPYWDSTREDAKDLSKGNLRVFLGARNRFKWTVTREPGQNTSENARLPEPDDVVGVLTNKANFDQFREIEDNVVHVGPHLWVGGHMDGYESPVDPLFWLHHCNVDRLWAIWQRNNPHLTGAQAYSGAGRAGTDNTPLDGKMPWSYPGGAETPKAVLDHTALGYAYERDFALERAWYEANGTILITGDRPLEMERQPAQQTAIQRDAVSIPRAAASMSSPSVVVVLDESYVYGNKRTKELHKARCQFVQQMNLKNMVPFESIREALKKGYNGCHFCLDEHDTD